MASEIIKELITVLSVDTFFVFVEKAKCRVCDKEIYLDEVIPHLETHSGEEMNKVIQKALEQYRKVNNRGV